MIKLSICMITYNHEKYIAQAIESVLMQKTDFDYEIVIGEDCSTDKTREIVANYAKKYPEKIKAILNEKNLGMIPNFINTLNHCCGKYIAMLDGDDYWTDPYKLQKQVDFLEANPDYGLVHTDISILFAKKNRIFHSYNKLNDINIPSGYVYEQLIIRDFIYTSTVMFRNSLIKDSNITNELISQNWLMGDYPLWLEISTKSKIGYISQATAIYRNHPNSICRKSSRQEILKSTYSVQIYFISKYGCSSKIKNKITFDYHKRVVLNWRYIDDIQLINSSSKFLESRGFHCYQMFIIKYLIFSNSKMFSLLKICVKIIKFLKIT